MNEEWEMYVVATVSGRLMWHTFSLWEVRSIYKFCKPDDWPRWQEIGYHVRKLRCISEMRMDGIFEEAKLKRELDADRKTTEK